MSQKKYFYILYFWLLSASSLLAQIQISFPSNRIVFQRNSSGNGVIPINGQFFQVIDRVEARVVPVVSGQGQQTNWQTIQQNPQGGFFAGSITVQGGWYQLEVRGLLNNGVVATQQVSRVGVGEVFLIAGQSNGQGLNNYGATSANDDRVSCINNFNSSNNTNELPQPNFVHLDNNLNISPLGVSAWYWGKLGDMLCSRLNVPVLFYNAAYGGSAVRNWQQTMNGGTTYDVYVGNPIAQGMPYANLRLALHYYAATTGLRAILWHQGEADNWGNTSTESYISDLKDVINKSRENYNRNIGWVVARASYDNSRGVNNNVVNGQNSVIATTGNVFEGPNTDVIQIPRPDGVHLQDGGLTDAAVAWDNALNSNFFANCTPHTGAYPSINTSCGNNQLNIGVQGSFQSVQWNNGTNSSNVSFGPGTYNAKATGNDGSVFFIPDIVVPNGLQVASASLSPNNSSICANQSVNLESSSGQSYVWYKDDALLGNITSQVFSTSVTGTYKVTVTNGSGCSATTNTATVSAVANPTADFSFNQTGAQVSFSNSSSNATSYAWSFGNGGQSSATNPTVTYATGGTYTVTLTATNSCGSTNQISKNVVIPTQCPNQPDLIITGMPITKYQSHRIQYTVQIKNQGSTTADLGSVSFYSFTSPDNIYNNGNDRFINGIFMGGNIPAGLTLHLSWNGSYQYDNHYYLIGVIDYQNLLAECQENNNTFVKTVNACTSPNGLTLAGNLAAGLYSTNGVVTLTNGTTSNDDVVVVGRAIVGNPTGLYSKVALITGSCLNVAALNANKPTQTDTLEIDSLEAVKPAASIRFDEQTSELAFELPDAAEVSISIWGDKERQKLSDVATNQLFSKGRNMQLINTADWVRGQKYIVHVQTATLAEAIIVDW
jgi:PKD repeat protein